MTRPAIIKQRSFPSRPAAMTDLPFIADVKVGPRKKRRCSWHVPPTTDYGHGCEVGRQYAADFTQYLKQNPCWVGSNMLGDIARDMAQFELGSAMNGYAVGFWAFVEQLIYAAATRTDHYAMAEALAQRSAAIEAAREIEAKGGGE